MNTQDIETLKAALHRLNTATKYGPDMASSRDVCIKDAIDLIESVIQIEDEEECQHDEHDHGYCLDCGEDITDSLVGAAEDAWQGDR